MLKQPWVATAQNIANNFSKAILKRSLSVFQRLKVKLVAVYEKKNKKKRILVDILGTVIN